jgi:hypothetical protein
LANHVASNTKIRSGKGFQLYKVSSSYTSLVIPKANTSFGCLSFQFSPANDWNYLQKSLMLGDFDLPH